jgi:hypothetical protein
MLICEDNSKSNNTSRIHTNSDNWEAVVLLVLGERDYDKPQPDLASTKSDNI